MKVALIGASGNVGSRILEELLRRGHEVTGIVRHPERLEEKPKFTAQRGDVNNPRELASLLGGHDAVIHSVKFQVSDARKVITAVKQAGVKRLLVVGGASTLKVASGGELLDTPDFPSEYKPEALAGRAFLNALREEKELDWTFLSPSALFVAGERTCKFRIGNDQLLVGENGESKISFEDFAVALVDELERPHHSRQRFTVGY